MKKITYVLIAMLSLSLIITLSFAQKADAKTAKKIGPRIIAGAVVSVSLADPVKGTKSEIYVMDETNKKTGFLVTATTTMYGRNSVPVTLEKIKKGERVVVKYNTTGEGVNEAISVRIAAPQ